MGDFIYGRPSATYLVTFFVSDFLRVPLYSAAHTVCLGEKYFKMKTFLDLYKHLFVYVYTLTMHLSFISRIVERFIVFIFCKDLFQLSSLLINSRDDVLNPNPLKGLTIIINFNLIQTSSFTFINCSRCLVQYS